MSNNKQNSVKILVEVEFEIDDIWSANSVDQEERAWFWNKVIPSCNILLHSNEVGDTVGETNTFTIKKISRKAREYTSPIIEELLNEKTMEMSNNKQTAVEWLIDQLRQLAHNQSTHLGMGDIRVTQGMLDEFEEQAKEMDKQQKMQCWETAHQAGRFEGKGIAEENWQTFEQYYNEEYGK